MDDLSRKFRSLDWKSFQKSARRMQASTASALKDLVMTDLENKTRSATSDTPWGASTTDLQAIAQGTNNRDDYALIMSIVWQRLGSSRWRCVYKALEVLKYLLMHGSSRCLHEAKGALGLLETLRMYRKMEGGRDVGEGVRRRAENVVEMLRDDDVLQRERERSEELRRKMVGGGEGPYTIGGHDSGRYDDTGNGDDSVNRVGTSGFKGYGDVNDMYKGYDDTPGMKGYGDSNGHKGYDDDAGGLKGYGNSTETPKANVDDLLGGEAADDDDDDEFDPRGNSATPKNNGELFDALAVSEGNAEAPQSADPSPATKESTSALVARLAAQQGAVVPASAGTAGNTHSSIWDDASTPTTTKATTPTTGGNDTPAAGIWADEAPAAAPAPAPVPTTSTLPKMAPPRKKEEDPFGDLLATARKTVL